MNEEKGQNKNLGKAEPFRTSGGIAAEDDSQRITY